MGKQPVHATDDSADSCLVQLQQTKTNYRSIVCSSQSRGNSITSNNRIEGYGDEEYNPHALFSNRTVARPLIISLDSSKRRPAIEFLEDRKIITIAQPRASTSGTRATPDQNPSPIRKFEERAERLHKLHVLDDLTKTQTLDPHNFASSSSRLSDMNPLRIYCPVRKTINARPPKARISFGSRRRTYEFDVYPREEQFLRGSDKYGKLLKQTAGDDDCDTDDQELNRAVSRCLKDLVEGFNLTVKKLRDGKRSTSEGPFRDRSVLKATGQLKARYKLY